MCIKRGRSFFAHRVLIIGSREKFLLAEKLKVKLEMENTPLRLQNLKDARRRKKTPIGKKYMAEGKASNLPLFKWEDRRENFTT